MVSSVVCDFIYKLVQGQGNMCGVYWERKTVAAATASLIMMESLLIHSSRSRGRSQCDIAVCFFELVPERVLNVNRSTVRSFQIN